MSWLLMLSIALVIGSLIGSIVLWVQSGETRVGLFGGLFLLFATHQGIELWSHWGAPFAIDAATATAIAGVLEGLLSVGIVIALSRTLIERDRIETIHWDSMETVRVMNELSVDGEMAFESKTAKLLETGKKLYGMEVGMFSRVSEQCYEVLAVDSPKDFSISRGAVFALRETFCESTIESERPIAVEQITQSSWNGRLDRAVFQYDAYLGAAVRVGGLPYGTLTFASSRRREDRFTATDKDLVRLMALWLGIEIERRHGIHTYIEGPLAERRPSEPQVSEFSEGPGAVAARITGQTTRKAPRSRPVPARNRRQLDANKILERAERQLRTVLGDEIALDLKLDPGLAPAAVSHIPIDAIVRTLVMNAKDAMAGGGELVIETANLELVAGEPGVIPPVAPDQYVTIAIRDTGTEPDADTLSRLYELAPNSHQPVGIRDPRDRLTLSTIYRLLKDCGGDLSVDIERARGSTFTVYLPRAKAISMPDTPPPTHSASTSIAH
ncbi:MAG: GAF domain-containing protein [Myxococcota bacterium]